MKRLQGRRIGIEHELLVMTGGAKADARQVLPNLPGLGPTLDPGDECARRGAWGGVITCDAAEVEVVTPPVMLSAWAVRKAIGHSMAGRATLDAALPADAALVGYSTHLNVEVSDRDVKRAALFIARRCAPALMLMLDRPDSPGLLVRPRHRRMEVGGEFVSGTRLRAAFTLAIAVALLAEAECRRRRPRLPELTVNLQRSPQRFGWYIDRRAFGADLYSAGRNCPLLTTSGAVLTADQHLTTVWTMARPYVDGWLDAGDVALVDAYVNREKALAFDGALGDDPDDVHPCAGLSLVEPWTRNGVRLTTVIATWQQVVLRVERGAITRYVAVPGEQIEDFVATLIGGGLDGWLGQIMTA